MRIDIGIEKVGKGADILVLKIDSITSLRGLRNEKHEPILKPSSKREKIQQPTKPFSVLAKLKCLIPKGLKCSDGCVYVKNEPMRAE